MGDQAKASIKQRRKHLTLNNKHLLITQKIYVNLGLVTSNPNQREAQLLMGEKSFKNGEENNKKNQIIKTLTV